MVEFKNIDPENPDLIMVVSDEERKSRPFFGKYKIIKNVLSKDACNLAKTAIYMQRDVTYMFSGKDKTDFTAFGDDTSPISFTAYASPVGEAILVNLKSIVEAVVERSLFESFSYCRIYSRGSSLPKHFDRESSEWSASLCLYNSDTPWPIFMDGESCELEAGDMVIYDGNQVMHWREDLNEDKEVLQMFLHYVDANGKYTDWKYDKRPALGTKPVI
jgi:hypothetical protein